MEEKAKAATRRKRTQWAHVRKINTYDALFKSPRCAGKSYVQVKPYHKIRFNLYRDRELTGKTGYYKTKGGYIKRHSCDGVNWRRYIENAIVEDELGKGNENNEESYYGSEFFSCSETPGIGIRLSEKLPDVV